MAQAISFLNMKGGVGKTTLAVNIAYGLAELQSKRVLLIDIDPQFNASQYLMTETQYLKHMDNRNKRTVLDIFLPQGDSFISTVRGTKKLRRAGQVNLASCGVRIFGNPGGGHLDLVPSELSIIQLETAPRTTENRLRQFLNSYQTEYDYVLIDCPPTVSIFTQAAILASHRYVVPLKPDPLSTIGLPLLERWLSDFTSSAGVTISPIGIILCMVREPPPRTMVRVMEELRHSRRAVFRNYLSQSTVVATSVVRHRPVFRYRPGSKWAAQVTNITQEFLSRTSEARR